MGDLNVRLVQSKQDQQSFSSGLLQNLKSLEYMLEKGWFETEQMHIGAEQELCLVDEQLKPAMKGPELLPTLDHPGFTAELARFNLELNLSPQPFKNGCFTDMQQELEEGLALLDKTLLPHQLHYLITGVLPTLRKSDLSKDSVTPFERYYALLEAIKHAKGDDQELHIKGYEELNIRHDTAMLEACNTSFQVHLQVTPDNFVNKYNLAQLIAGPVTALAANSPTLFGRRLWHETRIALFQQSIDTRITSDHLRDKSPRVMFGTHWIKSSVLDLYKEDIVRFRPMLMTDPDDCWDSIANGITPKLRALSIHNSTVYRWNRACYGVSPSGKPHLRIENRVFPAGPSVGDEMANAAFWLGLMNGLDEHLPNFTEKMDFAEVKSNFYHCAQTGLNTKVRWFGEGKMSVTELIRKELLPIAREGLEKNQVNPKDIDRLLDIVAERNESGKTGSFWALRSHANICKRSTKEEARLAIANAMLKNQLTGKPVHQWDLANSKDIAQWNPGTLLVEEFMTTDLFTVREEDIVALVADMMDWQRIRFTPVEDDQGVLVGLVSMRQITRHLNKNRSESPDTSTAGDLMIKKPVTIKPENTIFDAMNLMRAHSVGCLPVVNNDKLVGIITEGNFLQITGTLLRVINQRGLHDKE